MPAASFRAAVGAVTFLTRIPLGRLVTVDAADVARGAVAFPLVGAGVGAISGALATLLHPTLSPFVAATGAIGLAALVTGAMHLDALADTADALGAHDRERALAIMRDSRVGSFGATALVVDVLLKVGGVAALLQHGNAFGTLVAAGALSRAVSPPLAALLPYPRAEGGPGSVLTGRTPAAAGLGAAALGVGIAFLARGSQAVWLVVAAAAVAVALGGFYRRWLGGATGDCLGAVTELAETAVLLVAAALA